MGLVIFAGGGDPVSSALQRDLEKRPGVTARSHADLASATAELAASPHAVLVTCPAVPADDAIRAARELDEADKDVIVVMIASEPDTALLRAAMQAGVRDVLASTETTETILSSIVAADEAMERRHRAEPATAEAGNGKVISVFSMKGGVGKSVLATNLGVALASTGASTILADLDLQFGDVSVMLQIAPEHTIYDVVQAFDRLDAEMLRGFLLTHDSGLLTLLAPVRPEDSESCTSARVSQIIGMLRQLAQYVVLDTPASLSEIVFAALEQSDLILAVATMDVPSVKNTKVSLQKLRQLGFDGDMIRLVLNRADSKVWLEPHEIEKVISDRIVARIPSDRLVPRSVNKGVPVVLDAPKSSVAKSMLGLAREVAGS